MILAGPTAPVTPGSIGPARLATWLGLVLVGIIVTFVGGTFPYAGSGAARLVTHLAVGGLLGAWAVAIARDLRRGPHGPLVLPALTVAGAGVVSAVLSPVPRMALEGAIGMAATMAGLLLLVRILGVPWLRSRLEVVAIALPILLAVVVILEVVVAWTEWWGLVGSVQVPPLRPATGASWLGGPNVAAAALLVGYPTSLVLLRRRGVPAGPLAVLAAAGLVAILLTGSRGGLMALGVMAIVLTTIAAVGPRVGRRGASPARHRRPTSRPSWLGWLAVAIAVGLVVVLGPALVGRFEGLAGSFGQRADIWATAWNAFVHQPLTGTGPGTFPVIAPVMAPPSAQSLVVPHAHNTVLHVLSELGLIGTAAAAWLLGAAALLLARALRDPVSRPVASAAVLGLAGFATTSMVDHTLGLGAVSLMVALPVMLGSETSRPPATARPRSSRSSMLRFLPIALVLLGAGLVGRMDVAYLTGMLADDAAASGSWEQAAAAYRDASSGEHPLPLDLLGLGVAAAQSGDLDEAEASLARAVELDRSAHAHLLLAMVRLQLGDEGSVAALARHARDTNPDDPVVAVNAGAILEAVGDDTGAFDAYAAALVLSPELAASRWWLRGDPERPARLLAEALRRAAGNAGLRAMLLAFGGQPEAAREAAQGMPAADRAMLDALATLMEGDPERARVQLREMLDVNPQAAPAALWLSRIERALGRPEEADRYFRWATILVGWPAATNPRIGSAIVEAGDATVRPIPSNYPWAVYGRRGPGIFAVPGFLAIDPWPLPAGASVGQ